MLTQWIRVIHSDNGVLKDLTLAAQNSDTLALPLVAAEDSILIGQHYPFNNLFFDVQTVNANASAISTEIWTGTEYNTNVDHLDESSIGGVTWGRSGGLIFSPERDRPWQRVNDTSDADGPTDLTSLKLYNLYWMRLKVTSDLSAGTILNRMGYRFASTEQLNGLDPDLDQHLDSWETGKTDWDEQLLIASDFVIADMKSRGIIVHPGQILRMDEISNATAQKALMIIYSILGEGYVDRLAEAKQRYKELSNFKRLTLDVNVDGVEDRGEVQGSAVGMMVR